MRPDAAQHFSSSRGRNALLIVFVAPLMFLIHELVEYIFKDWACQSTGKLPIYLLTAFSLLIVAISGWVAWGIWNDAGHDFAFELGGPIGATRFVGFVSILFSALFFIAIIATSVPNWIMSACQPS